MNEQVDCDLCGSKKRQEILKQKDFIHNVSNEYFNLVKCSICSLNYLNPRPCIDDISKYYSKDYDFYTKNSFFKNLLNYFVSLLIKFRFILIIADFIPSLRIKRFIILRILPVIKYPFHFTTKTKFLDIGCGSGNNIHYWPNKYSVKNLYAKYKNIYAIEPSDTAFNNINLPLSQKKQFLESFEKIKFNHIRMNWSLEHVHKPSEYFNYISENLEKDGTFLLCIPNYNGIIYKVDPSSIEVPIHLYHFTYIDIKRYCEKFDLKIVFFKTFSYPGMFYFNSEVNEKFNSFKNLSPSGAYDFLKQISYFDEMGFGNDMIFVIKKLENR